MKLLENLIRNGETRIGEVRNIALLAHKNDGQYCARAAVRLDGTFWKQKEDQINLITRISWGGVNKEMRRRLKENTEIVCAHMCPMQKEIWGPYVRVVLN